MNKHPNVIVILVRTTKIATNKNKRYHSDRRSGFFLPQKAKFIENHEMRNSEKWEDYNTVVLLIVYNDIIE